MSKPTGRPPGRPMSIEPLIKRLCRDAAPDIAKGLIRQASIGDPQAAEIVLRIAMETTTKETSS